MREEMNIHFEHTLKWAQFTILYWLILVYSIRPIKTRSRDIVYNKLRHAEFLGKSHQK